MSEHIAPRSLYYTVFAVLMVLTVVTVFAAGVDLGFMNTIVAMTIAVAKATVVVLFFMHVRWSTRLTWVVVAAGVFWLGILLALTMNDYLARAWL